MRTVKIAKETDQLFCRFVGKPIIDGLRVPASRDNFFRAKLRKVLGKRALAQVHILPEFADGLFPIAQPTKDRQSLLAGKEFEKMRGVARARFERFDRR